MPSIEIPERFNAASYFVDANLEAGRAGNVAILFEDQVITYAQVAERVNQTGNLFRSMGVEIENRVMLVLPDCPELAYSFFGAIKIGAVPIPTNTLLKPHDYQQLLLDSRAKVLVISAELWPAVEPALDGVNALRRVVVLGAVGDDADLSFARLIAAQPTELQAANTHKDDVAFWLYTSGTTGRTRAAVHLQHDMVYCSELYARGILGITAADRTFSIAKLFFAYGLGNALYCPFAAGGTTILFRGRPQPKPIFEIVNRFHPTLFFAVPTAYAAMLQAAEQGAEIDMSSVRAAVSAGELLPASIYRRWLERFGVEILDGIGSTEILHIFLSNTLGNVRPGSTGTIVPGYDARIVDDGGQPVPEGEIGNLMVRGDSTCAYYWNQQESTRRTIQGEWIHTGDKYHVDADGYFWYDGRGDDMLKAGGIWVSPAEVEGVIVEHPRVLECAVVGALDDEGLVKPKAFVVLKEGAGDQALATEIQAFVKSRLAPYKYPRWIEFLDELPKTATGKIQRFKLREPNTGR